MVIEAMLRANVDAGSLGPLATPTMAEREVRATAKRGGRLFEVVACPTRNNAEIWFEVPIADEPFELSVTGADSISNDRVTTGDATFDARWPSSSNAEIGRKVLDAEVRAAFAPFLEECEVRVRPGKVRLRFWATWVIGAGDRWMGACIDAAFLLGDKVRSAIGAAQATAPSAAAWRASETAALAVRYQKQRRAFALIFVGAGAFALLLLVVVLNVDSSASRPSRGDAGAPTRSRPAPTHPARRGR